MSRADDGARPVLVGGKEEDAGITSHGVTRASMLRPGQKLKFPHPFNEWLTITTKEILDGEVTVWSNGSWWTFPESEMVKVRDILHTYTESETP
jgi:hypothetical protein